MLIYNNSNLGIDLNLGTGIVQFKGTDANVTWSAHAAYFSQAPLSTVNFTPDFGVLCHRYELLRPHHRTSVR